MYSKSQKCTAFVLTLFQMFLLEFYLITCTNNISSFIWQFIKRIFKTKILRNFISVMALLLYEKEVSYMVLQLESAAIINLINGNN